MLNRTQRLDHTIDVSEFSKTCRILLGGPEDRYARDRITGCPVEEVRIRLGEDGKISFLG